jgi:hypothetical protein
LAREQVMESGLAAIWLSLVVIRAQLALQHPVEGGVGLSYAPMAPTLAVKAGDHRLGEGEATRSC